LKRLTYVTYVLTHRGNQPVRNLSVPYSNIDFNYQTYKLKRSREAYNLEQKKLGIMDLTKDTPSPKRKKKLIVKLRNIPKVPSTGSKSSPILLPQVGLDTKASKQRLMGQPNTESKQFPIQMHGGKVKIDSKQIPMQLLVKPSTDSKQTPIPQLLVKSGAVTEQVKDLKPPNQIQQ